MKIAVLTGHANPALAEAVAGILGIRVSEARVEQFPDTEYHVEILDTLRGKSVHIIQPTGPPVSDHLFELLLLADASWRAGAAHVTAHIPFLGYARQDRRSSGREPVSARLVAELIRVSGVQRVVAVDLHTPALEGFFGLPLEHLTGVPLLAEALQKQIDTREPYVVIAPDLGAVKLAERYSALLGFPMAVVHKHRLSGEKVQAGNVVGDVAGRAPIVVDDMITTGGTIEAAVNAVIEAGGRAPAIVAASHSVLVGPAEERLQRLPLQHLVTTDSIAHPLERGRALPLTVCSLAALLAETVHRLTRGESLHELLAWE